MRVSDTLSGAGKRSVQRQDGGAMPSRSDKCDRFRRCRCYFRSQNGRQRRPHDTAAAYASAQCSVRERERRVMIDTTATHCSFKNTRMVRCAVAWSSRGAAGVKRCLVYSLLYQPACSWRCAHRSQCVQTLLRRVVPSALPGVDAI